MQCQLRSSFYLLVLFAVGVTAGCGGASRPSTYPVTGTVTFQGTPVAGAMVSFSPADAGTEARAAMGITDEQGNYSLTTFESGDGAMPGSYKVKVAKYDQSATPPVVSDRSAATDSAEGAMPANYVLETNTASAAPPKSELPERYASPSTTPLTFSVEATQNTYNIDLQ